MRARKAAANGSGSGSRSRPTGELDIFADPSDPPKKTEPRRVRRNSESSVIERNGKPLTPEEEKKRQERRRRERRHREREAKDGKGKKPDRKLDIIDQLDATSIYGTGRKCLHAHLTCKTNISKCSITMARLMHAILTEIDRAVDGLQCKHFQKTL